MGGPVSQWQMLLGSTLRVRTMLLWLTGVIAMPSLAMANEPPVVADLSVVNLGDGFWLLWGSVWDEDPETCRVDFGGDLQGISCVADSDGYYQVVLDLPIGVGGWVPAVATDSEALTSDSTYQYLANY